MAADDQLTLNYGLRFDQIFQYVDANQFSPRASLTYKPWWATVLHVGYMRTFTPPPQVLGRTIPTQIFDGTTQSAAISPPIRPPRCPAKWPANLSANVGSILPERAHVFDAGFVQQLLPQCPTIPAECPPKPRRGHELSEPRDRRHVYYKTAKDLIDDGQFGQAYTLTAFNYEKGEN